MVSLAGGRFLMGTDDGLGFADDAEGPQRTVEVSPFWMDRCPRLSARHMKRS
jgi:formylglycine-generating enzyme